MDLFGPAKGASQTTIAVGQLIRRARMALEGQFGNVWVKGEISNLKRQSSGHIYFTLKDADAQLSCVMFRGNAANVVGHLVEGALMEALGDLTVFEARGNMQMNVKRLRAAGQGALQAAFEALKAKLAAEGLFEAARKKSLPVFPRAVALVTSPTGAALQDMLNILQRRAPWLRVLLYPVKVQGVGAAEEIAAAVRYLSEPRKGLPDIDLLVVGRGGGSTEDLWCFNDEMLARAIAACPIPVISAVGHEIDFTIADFVADLRAPTPSAAAELLSPNGEDLLAGLAAAAYALETRSQRAIRSREEYLRLLADGALHRVPQQQLAQCVQHVDSLAEEVNHAVDACLASETQRLAHAGQLLRSLRPEAILAQRREQLASLQTRLQSLPQQALARRAESLSHRARLLRSLGPEAVLTRGYSLTTDKSGRPVSQASQLKSGDTLRTKFADGMVTSVVE
jgi:exodeoxyribonuclease VII large subunit